MIKGLHSNDGIQHSSMERFSFNGSSWTQPEGAVAAFIHEARVVNVNLVNWTIDVVSIFDQRRFFDIQVGSPYMHPTSGEGLYAVPEVGSKCLVCIPSDGPPPVVICFIMPMLTTSDTSAEDAPGGTAKNTGIGTGKGDFSFSGGRRNGKPGDIVARGRDGNFMILHRGGVAQFGATPLAQRICVPLGNLVNDISENYVHHNSAGTISWGVQERGDQHPAARMQTTCRVYADDAYADIRYSLGKVPFPVLEPAGDAGETSANTAMKIGTEEPTVFEFALAPLGFDVDTGETKVAPEAVKMRVFLDRAGNMMGRVEGAVNLRVKKKLRLVVDEAVTIICRKSVTIQADETVSITGKQGANIGTGGGVVAVNGGTKSVAYVGSTVKVAITVPLAVITPQGPGTIVAGILEGIVTSGNPTVLV